MGKFTVDLKFMMQFATGDKFNERETQLALALKTARIVVSASLAPATSESRPCSGKL